MEDMMPSPATPTQDEMYTDVQIIDTDSSSIQVEESSISSTQGQSINSSEDIRIAASPLSDVSDESLTEVPKGSKRKRRNSESAKYIIFFLVQVKKEIVKFIYFYFFWKLIRLYIGTATFIGHYVWTKDNL
jgi:hypothetical protein